MNEKPKVFEVRVTLGELIAAASILLALLTFTLKYESRIVSLETSQSYQDSRLNKLETVAERQADNQREIIRLLERYSDRPTATAKTP